MKSDAQRHAMMNIIVRQEDMINLLKESLDEVFSLLCQYMSAEEIDGLSCVEKINEAAAIKAELNGGRI